MSLLLRRSLRGYDVPVPAFTIRRSARVAGIATPALELPTKFRIRARKVKARASRRLAVKNSLALARCAEARKAFFNHIAELLVPYHGRPVGSDRGARRAFFAACEFVMANGAMILTFPEMFLEASNKVFQAERLYAGKARFRRLAADWRAFLDDLDEYVRDGDYVVALSRGTL